MKLDENAKIKWLGKENPFREGSAVFGRVEKVKAASGQTVKTYLNKGKGSTLRYCLKHKLAQVS